MTKLETESSSDRFSIKVFRPYSLISADELPGFMHAYVEAVDAGTIRRAGIADVSGLDSDVTNDESALQGVHKIMTLRGVPPGYIDRIHPAIGITHFDNNPVQGEVRVQVYHPNHLESPILKGVLEVLGLRLSGEVCMANTSALLFGDTDKEVILIDRQKMIAPPVELMSVKFARRLIKAVGLDAKKGYLDSYFDPYVKQILYGALKLCIDSRIVSGRFWEWGEGDEHVVDDEIFYPQFENDPDDYNNPYKKLLLRLGMGPYTLDEETSADEIREALSKVLTGSREVRLVDKLARYDSEELQCRHPRFKFTLKMSDTDLSYGTGHFSSYREFFESICKLAGYRVYRFPQVDNKLSDIDNFPNFEIEDRQGNKLLVFFSRSTWGTFGVEAQMERLRTEI